MKKFIYNLQFIFKPDYWLMNDPYNDNWDKKLNELLDKYQFTQIGNYTAKLGDNLIWISNAPYTTMTLYNDHVNRHYRASRLTIKRAIKALNAKKEKLENDFIDKIK